MTKKNWQFLAMASTICILVTITVLALTNNRNNQKYDNAVKSFFCEYDIQPVAFPEIHKKRIFCEHPELYRNPNTPDLKKLKYDNPIPQYYLPKHAIN